MDSMPAWQGDAARPGVIPLRPLGFADLVDGAIRTIKQHPGITLGTAALLATIQQTIAAAVIPPVEPTAVDPNNPTAALSGLFSVWTFVAAAISLILDVLLTGVITVVLGKAVIGRPAPAETVWQELRPRLLGLVGLSLLIAVICAAAMVPFAFAGGLGAAVGGPLGSTIILAAIVAGVAVFVWVYVLLTFAPTTLILEHCSVKQALSRSRQLVRGSWWRIFGILVLTNLIVGVITLIVSTVLAATGSQVVVGVGAILLSTVFRPFAVCVVALLYVDRRIRTENFATVLEHSAQTPGQDL